MVQQRSGEFGVHRRRELLDNKLPPAQPALSPLSILVPRSQKVILGPVLLRKPRLNRLAVRVESGDRRNRCLAPPRTPRPNEERQAPDRKHSSKIHERSPFHIFQLALFPRWKQCKEPHAIKSDSHG